MHMYYVIILILLNFCHINLVESDKSFWQGNWFPDDPGSKDLNPIVKEVNLTDDKHGIKMGIVDPNCDDAMRNLSVDSKEFANDYVCFSDPYRANPNITANLSCDHIPKNYWAQHICMNESISYKQQVPTFGNHRPLWATYGEYKYLPKQRWLHNLEHGGIVMLYHPCADKNEVEALKKILRRCLFRHIITPYRFLPKKRPLALVSWGCRLLMSTVNEEIAVNFIKTYALKGPELFFWNGKYKKDLLVKAKKVSDKNDTILCPAPHHKRTHFNNK